ncbi:hypothetical protein [Maridesulfovibrio ferrireducens]|uniref:Uncharacterized protein n=1 Tax=Maridesulfovibrio ferrireducens TaxID=246191 RepID=A0A1G9BS30_9BACT|nr:hypothetical protein [Maridesulfovibrio ferrireducens]MBI9111993.1 hypothetical protein [Maridesulfovibrio ferrireducens]SDK42246.1 hypothetical protein SAMN05660337_0399 [Maridesulfovibrio ferrireducens]
MSGFNVSDIPILLLIIGATIIPIWLGLRLRKIKPRILWIGMLLCLLFGPLGQVYVKGCIPWILILLGVLIGVQQLLPPNFAMIIMLLSSPLVMFYRLSR